MNTELGRVTHEYLYVDGLYYRRKLFGPAHWQVFNGRWQEVTCVPVAA